MEQYCIIVAYVLTALTGLCVGSFLNVVIYRVPLGMSIAMPASHCPGCDYVLKWYDNIPILSYIILGGKCRSCKCKISPRYTIVEAANMLLWLGCLFFVGFNGSESFVLAGIYAVACSVLICVFFIDLEHMIIPDRFQVILLCLGVAALAAGFFADDKIGWLDRVIGFVGGAAFFLAMYYIFKLIMKKEALGGGDVKLMAVCGLLLGARGLFLSMLLSSVVASVVLLSVKYGKGDENGKEYPFAPFLSGGIIIAMLFGTYIIKWYLGLLS